MLSRGYLEKILIAVMPHVLPGMRFKKAPPFPKSAAAVSIVGECEFESKTIKKAFVQVLSVPELTRQEIEPHIILKKDLVAAGYFGENDEYWVVNAAPVEPGVKEYAKKRGITLKDWYWVKKEIDRLIKTDKKLRDIVAALKTVGPLD